MTELTPDTGQGRGKSTLIKVAIVVLLAGAIGATLYSKNSAPSSKESDQMPGITKEEGGPTSKLPLLLDLGATKCIPCKMMAPILEELKTEYAGVFDVVFTDVWQNPDAAKAHNINLIPTQIFFDAAGKELFRHEGFFSKEDILNKWKEFGVGTIPVERG